MQREDFFKLAEAEQQSVLLDMLGFSNTKEKNTCQRAYLKANSLLDTSIVAVFEQIVEQYSEEVCVIFEGTRVTYAQINGMANQVAHFLIKSDIDSELVGLYMDPSIEMIASLIGILKAGLGYLPIDTKNAKDRIRAILDDAKPYIILSHSACQRLNIENTWIEVDTHIPILNAKISNPDRRVSGDDLAYVIYTSGSTGKPKGVPICHYNVINLIRSSNLVFDFSERDIWTCFHSISFDFSVWEIWGALLKGGKLVMIPFKVSRNFPLFYELLVKEKVTVLNQTATAFKLLCQTDEYFSKNSEPLSLRYVIFGGEALYFSSLKKWIAKYGTSSPKLINMFGITETTVHVTYREIEEADLDSGESMIGYPLPGTDVFLLDEQGKPVELGQVGEIYVSGFGLSKGYLNRSELTKQKFVVDPFKSSPHSYLYRTGDLAKYAQTGELIYLGRADNQIQVRGFRVEPGEIESAIREYHEIEDCIVTTQHSQEDIKLVAVLLPAKGASINNTQVRDWLKSRLPSYMLPDYFFQVKAFPLNKNGKLDLSQLEFNT